MTDTSYRHYIFIIDSSGSMVSIRDGMQSGLMEFASEHAAIPGRATASVWDFGTEPRERFSFGSLDEVRSYELIPHGMTALNDAVCMAIDSEGQKLAALPDDERPSQVGVLIITDGRENYSKKYRAEDVKARLDHQRDRYQWKITFLGANQDAIMSGAMIGVHAAGAMTYNASDVGTRSALKSSSRAMKHSMTTNTAVAYSDADRQAAQDNGE